MAEKQSVAVSYKVMRHEPQYLKMIAANLVNRFGDSVDAVAFGWMVYQLTGSSEWLAVMMGVNLLPTVLLQPFAGAWVNYLNKKVVMVLCDMGRGTLVCAIALLFVTGRLTPGILLCITVVNSSLEALRQPCGMAVLPRILRRENFAVATALNQSVSRGAELVGMALAGVIIAVFGVGGAILVDAVTFFLSGAILCFLRLPPDEERVGVSYLGELRGGLSYFWSNRAVVVITLLCVLLNLFEFPVNSLKAAYISETLRMGEDALTVSSAAYSVGLFAGTLLFPRLFGNVSGRKVCLGCGLSLGMFYLLLAGLPLVGGTAVQLVLLGLFYLCFGFVSTSVNMSISVAIFQNVSGDYMARVGSLFNAIACASSPVAAAATAVIAAVLPINRLYLAAGLLSLVVFLLLTGSKAMRALK